MAGNQSELECQRDRLSWELTQKNKHVQQLLNQLEEKRKLIARMNSNGLRQEFRIQQLQDIVKDSQKQPEDYETSFWKSLVRNQQRLILKQQENLSKLQRQYQETDDDAFILDETEDDVKSDLGDQDQDEVSNYEAILHPSPLNVARSEAPTVVAPSRMNCDEANGRRCCDHMEPLMDKKSISYLDLHEPKSQRIRTEECDCWQEWNFLQSPSANHDSRACRTTSAALHCRSKSTPQFVSGPRQESTHDFSDQATSHKLSPGLPLESISSTIPYSNVGLSDELPLAPKIQPTMVLPSSPLPAYEEFPINMLPNQASDVAPKNLPGPCGVLPIVFDEMHQPRIQQVSDEPTLKSTCKQSDKGEACWTGSKRSEPHQALFSDATGLGNVPIKANNGAQLHGTSVAPMVTRGIPCQEDLLPSSSLDQTPSENAFFHDSFRIQSQALVETSVGKAFTNSKWVNCNQMRYNSVSQNDYVTTSANAPPATFTTAITASNKETCSADLQDLLHHQICSTPSPVFLLHSIPGSVLPPGFAPLQPHPAHPAPSSSIAAMESERKNKPQTNAGAPQKRKSGMTTKCDSGIAESPEPPSQVLHHIQNNATLTKENFPSSSLIEPLLEPLRKEYAFSSPLRPQDDPFNFIFCEEVKRSQSRRSRSCSPHPYHLGEMASQGFLLTRCNSFMTLDLNEAQQVIPSPTSHGVVAPVARFKLLLPVWTIYSWCQLSLTVLQEKKQEIQEDGLISWMYLAA
jgi:hypothetical protein